MTARRRDFRFKEVLDTYWYFLDNEIMPHYATVEEIVKQSHKAAKAFRKEIQKDPAKAKAFLIRAGIAQKSKTHPSGVELVPELRTKG